MNALPLVLEQVLVLFVVVFAGGFARKKNIITEESMAGMTGLTIQVAMPCLLFMAFQKEAAADEKSLFVRLLFICLAMHVVAGVIATLVCRMWKNERQKPIMWHLMVLSNCAFMGLPLVEAAFGADGLLYSAAYIFPFNLVFWTVGMIQFTGKKGFTWKALVNPGVLSILLGILCFFVQWQPPAIAQRVLQLIGGLTTPLSMLLIGARLSQAKLSDFRQPGVWVASLLRLVAMPLLMFAALKLLGVSGIALGLPVLLTALPGAASTALFAERYGGDASFASHCVSLSTLLSLLTVPIILLICAI